MRLWTWVLPCLFVLVAGCTQVEDQQATTNLPATERAQDAPRDVELSWEPDAPKAGQVVIFEAQASGAAAFHWAFGDGGSDQGAEVSHIYDRAGVFEVEVRVAFDEGPDVTRGAIVSVGPGAERKETQDDAPEQAPRRDDPVILVEADELAMRFSFSFDGTPDDIGWDFGDGRTSQGERPTHAYERPGHYTVRLSLREGLEFYTARTEVNATTELPTFHLSSVGRPGPEPSVGVTSDGCIFFIARWDVMRSCDFGASWRDVSGVLAPVIDSDPYLWVDPATDRVFRVNMLHLACTQIGFTDDGGGTWVQNPLDCGPVPVNDHIKLATGPWTDAGYGIAGPSSPAYEQAVYFCYNKLVGVYCYTSFDGGLTFPVGGLVFGMAGSGGLHGAITTAPDATVYVPPRSSTPTVHMSKDNGLTWSSRSMGKDVGTPDPRKNSEVATDTDSNAYHVWISSRFGVYMSRSTDSGLTWDQRSTKVSPDFITSATFAHAVAGDPGRLAVAYLGSSDHAGNPHDAPDTGATYHLYVTFSTNALDAEPTFTTVQVTEDPVQVGSICLDSGDCSNGNRNLLDFNDLHIDRDGRVYVAFADGCTGACATAGNPTSSQSRDDLGTVAILATGPSLYADVGSLSSP